jgi:membrane protease YdiL (CAAX protease family)
MSTGLEKALKLIVLLFFAGFYLLLLLAHYLGLVYAIFIVPHNMIANAVTLNFGLFLPYYLPLFSISGFSALVYFIIIVIILFFSLCFLVYVNWRGCLNEMRTRKHTLIASHNPLLMVSEVFCIVLFLNIMYSLFLSSVNVEPASPDFESTPMWINMLSLAHASVYEEFAVRVLLLALPLFVIQRFVLKKKVSVMAFFRGEQKVDALALALLILSSLIFALAHMLYGWDVYKVLPAFIAGVGFGYAYLKGGIFASILLHFSFDYMDITYMLISKDILSDALALLSMPGILLSVLVLLFSLAAGPVTLYGYARKFAEKLPGFPVARSSEERTERQERVEGGLFMLQFPVGRCPKCGAEEARYLGNDMLECVRCGEKRRIGR